MIEELITAVDKIRLAKRGNPRIHPNGFIQLDLEPVADTWEESFQKGHSGSTRRLHIWNPPKVEIPHQGTVNEIHDHVFDMFSTVIYGTLWQILYNLDQRVINISSDSYDVHDSIFESIDTHEKYRAVYSTSSTSRLESTGEKGKLREVHRFPIVAIGSYFQPAFTLHDSKPEGCVITIMEKRLIHDGEASVICPIDIKPDNSFDRTSVMPIDEIWQAINNSLILLKRSTIPVPTPYG